MDNNDIFFINKAIELSQYGFENGFGGPFGCVIVKNGEIVGEGFNRVTSSNDPTAHAEVVAIRDACKNLNTFQLDDCIVYTSCEPCPMCLGAIYWSRPAKVIFANTRKDAAEINFDDDMIYHELNIADYSQRKIPFLHMPSVAAKKVFENWASLNNKIDY
jgi:guanine deaminase